MDYKISIDLTYTWEIFQEFFAKKYLDDFSTVLPVANIVTKYTFIRIILEDTIEVHDKK